MQERLIRDRDMIPRSSRRCGHVPQGYVKTLIMAEHSSGVLQRDQTCFTEGSALLDMPV